MRVAFIAAGAAGMYCGSCLRDAAAARAMRALGHDVLLVPLYTPLKLDSDAGEIAPIFYGGINVYLQQKSGLFRKTPRWLDRLFDSKLVLNLSSKLAGMTKAAELGELVLSTLRGEEGNQLKELDRLADWLADEAKPEIINLPNTMFAGAIRRIKARIKVPVVCSMTGEDLFLEGLPEPYKSQALAVLRERVADADGFIATSRYYADFMAGYLGIPREKIDVAPLGVDAARFGRRGPRVTEPFTVGYLARIAPEKGFHILCEAFALLKKMPGAEGARLRAAGWLGAQDRKYFEEQKGKLKAWGLEGSFDYAGEIDFAQKREFLDSLSVLSVPTVYREPKGLFVYEALAHGVPVVQPSHGAFPEVIEATGGGILCEPENPADLAAKLHQMTTDREMADRYALRGQEMVRKRFNDATMARAIVEAYEKRI